MKRMEADGRPARAAFERRKEQKRIEHINNHHKRGYYNHERIERSFKCVPTAEEQTAIDAENKIIEEKKLQKEQEAIIQKQKARLEALKRAKERKIEEEARRRIDEMAEQLAFESAVQKKMTELLASTSTLDARMKLREAELKDLFM
jgi:molecular chaperone DnaK (HSP70)